MSRITYFILDSSTGRLDGYDNFWEKVIYYFAESISWVRILEYWNIALTYFTFILNLSVIIDATLMFLFSITTFWIIRLYKILFREAVKKNHIAKIQGTPPPLYTVNHRTVKHIKGNHNPVYLDMYPPITGSISTLWLYVQ